MIWDVALYKRFRDRSHDFELDVQFRSDAQRLVLFGPSGAGKSMTLRMMAGLERPQAGHVRIGDAWLLDRQAGLDVAPQQRRLAYVFQDYALFPHLTVVQNIAFGLRRGLLNPSRRVKDEAVRYWLETLHLQEVAGHYPAQLSGGQRQRTALARALMIQPRALLLDEPFSALDRALRQHLREELAELQARLQIPLILITHDEEDAQALGEAIIPIREGRVVAPQSVREPAWMSSTL